MGTPTDKPSASLNRNQFFDNAPPLALEKVETPELGEGSFVYVQELSASDREILEVNVLMNKDAVEDAVRDREAGGEGEVAEDGIVKSLDNVRNMRPVVTCLATVDKDRNKIFEYPQDVERLCNMTDSLIKRIAGKAFEISGMTKESQKKTLGNSPDPSPSDSNTDSV